MSVEENNRKILEEVTKAFAEEGKARIETRMLVLEAIKRAAKENNSGSVKALAEAYNQLGGAMSTPGVPSFPPRPAPTAIPGGGFNRG